MKSPFLSSWPYFTNWRSARKPNTAVFPDELSPSFYGRDVVVSAAVHLSAGFPIEQVGPRVSISEIVFQDIKRPFLEDDGSISAETSILDKNFGTVWTTIPLGFLEAQSITFGDELELLINDELVIKALFL